MARQPTNDHFVGKGSLVCGWQLVVRHRIGCRIEAVQIAQQEAQREAQLPVGVCRLQSKKTRLQEDLEAELGSVKVAQKEPQREALLAGGVCRLHS